MLREHHPDVAVEQPAGAVEQVLPPPARIVPEVADLADQADDSRHVAERKFVAHWSLPHPRSRQPRKPPLFSGYFRLFSRIVAWPGALHLTRRSLALGGSA